jgi:peptide/nickel transport system substrate-binding protein
MTRVAAWCASICLAASVAAAPSGGELRFCLYSEPKTFHPLLVADASSEAVRYLTAGVLIRVNRLTQELEPELAESWQVLAGGKAISFKLRRGVAFSDGTPFTAEDVAYTMRTLFDPGVVSPTADPLRASGSTVKIDIPSADRVIVTFATALSGVERLFDQVGILSSRSPKKEMAVLGPFLVAEYKPGSEVHLQRNPYYWKRDAHGRRLPYLDSLRLSIQQNRELEAIRFLRGELDLMTSVSPETFDQLKKKAPTAVRDLGPSLEPEMLWFNQAPGAPIPEFRKAWFRSKEFRRALSAAINREDLCRLAYRGHASPAAGPVSPANRFWFNASLRPHRYDTQEALDRLNRAGFRLQNGVLRDAQGNAVEFSLITNAGNQPRERIAQLIEQDLKAIGIRLNVVRLDYSAIMERLNRSLQYEACLLGLTNVDLDPNGQMNVWLSSAASHQWNPDQSSPGTPWEAEIDRLMRAQNSAASPGQRKVYFDRVQEIVWDQAPFLYLVNKNALVAISSAVANSRPAVLRPQAFWNIDTLALAPETARSTP